MPQLGRAHAIQRLVGTDIDRANRHRQALHGLDGTAIGVVLLFFVGQVVNATPHEKELAAKQPDAHRTSLQRGIGIFGHFNVGKQLDAFAIQRDRRGVAQASQPAALHLALALAETVFLQHDGGRIDDDQAGIAIDDDVVVLADQVAGLARTHHGRNVHAAGHDGGVGCLAAHIGNKALEHAALEIEHVGGRNVAGDQHQRLIATEVPLIGGNRHPLWHATPQGAQQTFDHLFQVGLALAQVGIFHLVEVPRQHFELRRQRPLGVVVTLGDPLDRGADQRLVLQQHLVHIQQGGQLGRRIGGQVPLEHVELSGHHVTGLEQACHLITDLGRINEVVRHINAAGRHQNGTSDGHAARYRQTKDLNAHRVDATSASGASA